MLLIFPQLHFHTLLLCSSLKEAKQICLQVPDSLHTLWLEISCHSFLLHILKPPIYLLYVNLPVFLDILFLSLFLWWDNILILLTIFLWSLQFSNWSILGVARAQWSLQAPLAMCRRRVFQTDAALQHWFHFLTPLQSWYDMWVGHLWYALTGEEWISEERVRFQGLSINKKPNK